MNYRDMLYTIPMLKVIDPELIEASIARGEILTKTYSEDEIIHFDGDQSKYMEIILEGEVTVERIDEKGHLMTVATFNTGNCLGANLLFSSNPYFPMTVSAKSQVMILCITKKKVFHLCTTNEKFLELFMRAISDHTILLGTKIKYYVNRTIRESITTYVLHESHRQKCDTIQLNCTKKALAERMGIQRTSLSRELQKMRNEGLIEFNEDSITLTNIK